MITLFVNIQINLGQLGWSEMFDEEKFRSRTPEQIEEIRRDVVSIMEVSLIYCIHE